MPVRPIARKKDVPVLATPSSQHTAAPLFRNGHVPNPSELRRVRQLQQRLEAGFWDDHPDDQWVPTTEAPLGSAAYQRLSAWYLRRKPFLQRKALEDYCRLLLQHMKGRMITAHASIDPEDGWLCLWFTVYGLPRLRRFRAIHEEHRHFLDALFDEGLHTRHTSGHIGLMIARTPYRPTR